jgi:hemoglobin-like flavoprotein
MTEKQILLVKHSWSYLAGQLDDVTIVFAKNIIALDPTLKPLTQQLTIENKLREVLITVNDFVACLPNFERAEKKVLLLITNFSNFNVTRKSYDIAILAFLQALHKMLGETWDQEIHDAWLTALTSMQKHLLDQQLSSVTSKMSNH